LEPEKRNEETKKTARGRSDMPIAIPPGNRRVGGKESWPPRSVDDRQPWGGEDAEEVTKRIGRQSPEFIRQVTIM